MFKIKINELPSLDKEPQITTSIKDNPYKANAEIEKDEYVLAPDLKAIYKAVGKTHKQGGIETYLPEGSFIFSDDPNLHLDDDDHNLMELKKGTSSARTKNTPADVLKRNVDTKHYNKMTSIIDDKNKDEFSKRTAALMLNKYENAAGRIAYVQEAKKDFPDGVPEFAQGTAPVYDTTVKNEIMEQKQYMKRGGYFQQGGSKYRSIVDNWNKTAPSVEELASRKNNPQQLYDPSMLGYAMTHGDSTILPPFMKGNPIQEVTSPQHKLASGLYGQDFDTNEFRQRHDWYFKDHPNFDFKNPKDVLDFQNTYNSLSNKITGSNYFGIDNGFRSKDGKAGLYTQSAPNIFGQPNHDELPPVTVYSSPRQKPQPGPVVPTLDVPAGKRTDINWDFNPWQKLNMGADALAAASVQEEFPYRSQVSSPLVELERVNPQAALNGADNAAFRASANNRGLNPYLAAGSNASIYGQNLDAKQGIQSQYDNQNVGIGNEQNIRNNATQIGDQRFNVGADQQYYRETVEGRKNFQNLKQASWNNFRNNMNSNVEQNQSLAYNLAAHPNSPYGYDFKSGQFYLTGKNPLDVYTNPNADITNQYISKIGSTFDSLPAKQKVDFLKVIVGNKALQLPQYYNPSFRKGGMKKNPYKK